MNLAFGTSNSFHIQPRSADGPEIWHVSPAARCILRVVPLERFHDCLQGSVKYGPKNATYDEMDENGPPFS